MGIRAWRRPHWRPTSASADGQTLPVRPTAAAAERGRAVGRAEWRGRAVPRRQRRLCVRHARTCVIGWVRVCVSHRFGTGPRRLRASMDQHGRQTQHNGGVACKRRRCVCVVGSGCAGFGVWRRKREKVHAVSEKML